MSAKKKKPAAAPASSSRRLPWAFTVAGMAAAMFVVLFVDVKIDIHVAGFTKITANHADAVQIASKSAKAAACACAK